MRRREASIHDVATPRATGHPRAEPERGASQPLE